jgi:hypothetical protein
MTRDILDEYIKKSNSRIEFWIEFVNKTKIETVAEIGIYKGDFTAQLLKECKLLKKYYMIDPWKHLEDWNKPANVDNGLFEHFLKETEIKTNFAKNKRMILRGRTMEVIDQIPNESLDFIYIDGDHTLRGITIDLINSYHKIRNGGWIGGDDFVQTIWQHPTSFEPSFIFPFAVYFAEAINAPIYGLPYNQFLIEKREGLYFKFIDVTGRYNNLSIKHQLSLPQMVRLKFREMLSSIIKFK